MKQKFIYVFALCTLLVAGSSLSAQTFEVPRDVKLEQQEDYKKYEQDVVQAADWLVATNLDMETVKRREVNTFLVRWLTGTPDITIQIGDGLTALFNENSELLIIYMAVYGKYCIQHKDAQQPDAIKAALDAVLTVYKKGIRIENSPELDKLTAMDATQKDRYIRKKLVVKK